MRKNSTLPIIKQPLSVSTNRSKQGIRKLQDKLLTHDQQIIRNEKTISNLANQFRLLKEQLEFEQQYNQQHKSAISKYQQQSVKNAKIIKDQKQIIARLQMIQKEKQKNVETMNKEVKGLRQKMDQMNNSVQQMAKQMKKKQNQTKALEVDTDKLKKQNQNLKKQLKQKDSAIKQELDSSKSSKDNKQKKMEKDLESLTIYLQNSKQAIVSKQREIQKLTVNIHSLEERLKNSEKNQMKTNGLMNEVKLLQHQNDSFKNRERQYLKKIEVYQATIKNLEGKIANAQNEKIKQLNLQKNIFSDKYEKLLKEVEDLKIKIDNQNKEKLKKQKKDQQAKQRLMKFQASFEKIAKIRTDIAQQLSKLKANILCQFCNKPMKNPVTNIPCGHSYCQDCKAGYMKQCKKCPGIKREAVYRNQLLDQVIQAGNLIEKIVGLFP